MALSGTVHVLPVATQTSELDLVTGSAAVPTGSAGTAFGNMTVTNGTGANQGTAFVSDTRTLAASASETLDFNVGLSDVFGTLVPFTRLILFMLKASPNNLGDIDIVLPSANPITTLTVSGAGTIMHVQPGGTLLWMARSATAFVVTAGTADTLTFTNTSPFGPATYDILAVGS